VAKVAVIQHVPFEPLGTIVSLLRERRHRIRHINFVRQPHQKLSVENYDALIILGGPMDVHQTEQYPFLLQEVELIKQAIDADIPVLGICLGAQLIAKALGAEVYPAQQKEIGWYPLSKISEQRDPVLEQFGSIENLFQWHRYTFDLPNNSEHLLSSSICPNQAFRFGEKVYGFQFHLEVSEHLIERWLSSAESLSYLSHKGQQSKIKKIRADTEEYIEQSVALSHQVFGAFLDLLPTVKRRVHLGVRHRFGE